MPECPICKFEFAGSLPKVGLAPDSSAIFCHDCQSGYIRSYPVAFCADCIKTGYETKTIVMLRKEITRENRRRKARYFREMDMSGQGQHVGLSELVEEAT